MEVLVNGGEGRSIGACSIGIYTSKDQPFIEDFSYSLQVAIVSTQAGFVWSVSCALHLHGGAHFQRTSDVKWASRDDPSVSAPP